MTILFIIAIAVIFLFANVLLHGAPFLPTLSRRLDDALDLLDLEPGQTMLELGSGDGRLLRAAAKRGINGVGYELNPLLVFYSKFVCWKYRKNIRIYWGNYWQLEWPEADGIYTFLLNPFMEKLDNEITQYANGHRIKLVSFAFKIPNKKPKKEINGMYLYEYN